jgi:hypothetical protein
MAEDSSQTLTGTDTGNTLTGAYTLSESAAGTYSMSEQSGTTTSGGVGGLGLGGGPSPNSMSLTETGSLTTTTTEAGSTLDGSYNRTINATDHYTMVELGANASSDLYTETVTGTDTSTLTEAGNTANQTYSRTITDSDVYTRTDAGPGAAFAPSSSGTIGSTLTESSDARAGVLSQSETGSDRYSLLQNFINVANTGGNAPGNMDYYIFGEPFVDPNPPSPNTVPQDAHIDAFQTIMGSNTSLIATFRGQATAARSRAQGFQEQMARGNARFLGLDNEIAGLVDRRGQAEALGADLEVARINNTIGKFGRPCGKYRFARLHSAA